MSWQGTGRARDEAALTCVVDDDAALRERIPRPVARIAACDADRHADRTAGLAGQLAAAIAHHANQPLMSLSSSAGLRWPRRAHGRTVVFSLPGARP
jgi:hypothetical protein